MTYCFNSLPQRNEHHDATGVGRHHDDPVEKSTARTRVSLYDRRNRKLILKQYLKSAPFRYIGISNRELELGVTIRNTYVILKASLRNALYRIDVCTFELFMEETTVCIL